MRKFKIKLWLILTTIGLVGVASLLLSSLPLDALPKEALDLIPPETLRFLLLVNPALLLIVATTVGVFLYDKVGLSIPIFEKLLGKSDTKMFSLRTITTYGVALGAIAGALIVLIASLFTPYLPPELTTSTDAELSIFTKLLYGGLTEELLMRFGLMSFLVWIIFKFSKRLTVPVYWLAIILSSIVFALGHLPLVLGIVAEPTFITYLYIILANSLGGLLFGFAYYRQGLECAFIAHAVAHLTMLALAMIL